MARDAAVDLLLAVTVLLSVLCSLGLLVMRDTYQRLHLLGPVGIVAPIPVAIAVLVREGVSQQSVKAFLVVLALMVASPVLGHATARATRIRERGDWRPPASGEEATR